MGTKMTLHRYLPTFKDWEEIEYYVDEDFINTYGSLDPTIPTGTPYEIGVGSVEVYLNGNRLPSSKLSEVDNEHIKLLLGRDLLEGDHIYIRVYMKQFCSRGQSVVSYTQIYNLQKEIHEARKYKGSSLPYRSLDERLDSIQKHIEMLHGWATDVEIIYEHNDRGQITKEIVTGNNGYTRELLYYEDEYEGKLRGQLKQENIFYQDEDGKTHRIIKDYFYDVPTKKLIRTTVRVE